MIDTSLKNLKENVSHGDFMFPFIMYDGTLDILDPLIPIHWHEEFEITLIEKGIGQYKINLADYTVEEGDIIFIHPETLHASSLFPNKTYTWRTMVFNFNMLKSASTDGVLIKYLAPLATKEYSLPIIIKKTTSGYTEIYTIFKEILKCYEAKDIAFELEIKSLLFKLFMQLYRNNLIITNTNLSVPTNVTADKIKLVLNYIHENYNKEISIITLANLCSFSEYYFMRFFKKHIGMSCIQYLNSYRLEKATNLLITTDKSIMDISFDVGFESLSYFIKLFKRKYKITPLEFRKRN